MSNMMYFADHRMNIQMSEDVCAPELRDPRLSGLRKGKGWLARLLDGMKKA